MVDTQYIFSICNIILSQLNNKKLDLYSIFRLLTTNKKTKFIDLGKFDFDNSLNETQKLEMQNLISQVNPFFKNNASKLDFYIKNYKVATFLLEKCLELEAERQKIYWYKIKKQSSKNYMSADDFFDNDDRDVAIFYDRNEAGKNISKYLKLFKYLQIDCTIELIGFNKQGEILELEVFT